MTRGEGKRVKVIRGGKEMRGRRRRRVMRAVKGGWVLGMTRWRD